MTQLMDHVTYLSKEIGPRPAGTEEEQRAALYITEQFQKETGFEASMEEFTSSSNVEAGLAVMAGVVVVVTILAMIFPVLAIPAFILAAAAAVVYSLEEFDKPIISRVLSRGASQNVVAKYKPAVDPESGNRTRGSSRKIILMAHYDTGNVTPPLIDRLEKTKIPLALVCVAGVIAATFFLLIRIFVASGGGMGLLVLNVLSIIAIILCLYPIAKALLIRTSPYNEGAVNNATGTAALMEVAHRIAHGSVSEAELANIEEEVVIHGEEAAREAGLIPDGVQLVYEAEQVEPESPQPDEADEEERLLSAKAAIAALTGQPVERKIYATITPASPARTEEEIIETPEYIEESNDELMLYGESYRPDENEFDHTLGSYGYQYDTGDYYDTDGFQNAPSWFVAAQQNARRSDEDRSGEPQIKRSAYTEAITSAERNLAQREEEMREAQRRAREEAQRAREEEFRALMEAREENRRAAMRAEAKQREYIAYEKDVQPIQVAEMESAQPIQPVEVATVESVQQRPDSTIAMTSAPVPAAEILAEARAAEEAGEKPDDLTDEQTGAISKVTLDAASIPIPPQEETAYNRISTLPSIDPANPHLDQAAERPTPVLPEIEPEAPATQEQVTEPSRSGILRRLRTNIPSLSGLISPVSSESSMPTRRSVNQENLSSTVPPVNVEPTAEPVVLDNNVVEIPRSRSGSIMNRLRGTNEDNLTGTPQEWLAVEEDFDPLTAGRERGGWESFRDDQYAQEAGNDQISADYPVQQTRWQGGAYSRVQLGHVDMRSGNDTEADTPIVEEPVVSEDEAPIAEEIQQIYHFRNPLFNTEIWFVAVGADGASHDGARAFVEEHRDELRGSMIIEIESLGAGSLSVASEEGRIRKAVVSSRVKRYTRNATAATGIAVSSTSLAGTDSIASTLQKAGYQAMHLFGAEDGRPALKGSADDVVENVDELALEEHVGFVYELLKR